MGSQMIADTTWGAVLGHPYNPDQIQLAYWYDQIAAVSLGTSTAKTQLGGSQVEGTSAQYIVPTNARCIVAVRPKLITTTPTANQAFLATMKIESTDLGMRDYEVFANPIDSGLGTNEMQLADKAPWWPLMQPVNGSERVNFFGTPQIANTVAPLMSVDVLLSDTYPEGYSVSPTGAGQWRSGYGVVQSKIGGIVSGGGPTATSTAAGTTVTDGGVTVSSPFKRLIALTGVVVGTTPAASKPVSGQFSVAASELVQNPLKWNIEPILGFLGTTTTGYQDHLSIAGPMNLLWKCTSTIKASFALDTAITTAGNFEMGYVYIDKN